MSGKTLLDQIDDLSEDDHDFVPEPKAKRTSSKRRHASKGSPGSDSCSSSDSGTEDEDHVARKLKADPVNEADQERKEKQAQADWKSILDVEEEAKKERELGLKAPVTGEELVEITRPRFFAGETIYETVRLPKAHPDVKKYGAAVASSVKQSYEEASPSISNPSTPSIAQPQTTELATTTSPVPLPSVSASTEPTKLVKGPIRRKPRQSLESMNAALVAASKGKKMTTIEKSAHDWSAHTSRDATLAEQLAANRRENGGGYLEKKEFLDRVGDRRDELLENGKSRRKR